jgi:ribosome maturation factor RimP
VEVTEMTAAKKKENLISVTEQAITTEEQKGKGKKMETVQHTIPFENIKTTKIQIKF